MTASELRVLRADVSGMPIEWIGYEEAVKLYYLDRVLYPMGQSLLTLRGGVNNNTPVLLEPMEHYYLLTDIG